MHRDSLVDPAAFWGEAARAIDWFTPPSTVLGPDPRQPDWFAGGQLNICFNALDRHVIGGRGDQVALIHDSPVTRTIRHVTVLRRSIRQIAADQDVTIPATIEDESALDEVRAALAGQEVEP
jgi:acetyl-CoA synthetase-like protein